MRGARLGLHRARPIGGPGSRIVHMPAQDYAHIIIACLTHIGYVRGLFREDSVAPHVQTAIRYLNVTSNGRQWIANLYSNVFRAERDIYLSGPQK